MKRRALFLDIDSVINANHGYVYRKDELEILEGIYELVASACRSGHLLVIVTNHAGIGRGYYKK